MAERGSRKVRVGTVVSAAMNKTCVVEVESRRQHPLYKKSMKRTHKFHAHDEDNETGVGDVVKIAETRPLSKQKRWRLMEIIQKAK